MADELGSADLAAGEGVRDVPVVQPLILRSDLQEGVVAREPVESAGDVQRVEHRQTLELRRDGVTRIAARIADRVVVLKHAGAMKPEQELVAATAARAPPTRDPGRWGAR